MQSKNVFSSEKVDVSFSKECGIYSSNIGFRKTLHENSILHIFDEGITIDRIRGDLDEISPEQEARALISLFEDLVVGHHEFLSDYQFTNKLPYTGAGLRTYRPYECLQRLSKDFKLDSERSSFAVLYRELEDELIGLSYLSVDEPIILTGDNMRTAKAIDRRAGIEHVIAQVLPDEKADMIRKLHESGHRVAMVETELTTYPPSCKLT